MAKRWAKETPDMKGLPQYVGNPKQKPKFKKKGKPKFKVPVK